MQVTILYIVFGFFALYFSDVVLPRSIENNALLAQIQALKGGIEVVITGAFILALTTRSRRAIEEQNRKLIWLNAEHDVLHRVFRHNLRHDLNLISGFAELIEEEAPEDSISEYCRQVINGVHRIHRYQTKIAQMERVLDSQDDPQRIDLVRTVREHPLVGEFVEADEVIISLDLPDSAHVIAIPSISDAITQALENAAKHVEHDRPMVDISIKRTVDKSVDLIISDNGPGIPAQERQAIESMSEENLTHSSGVGMWLSKLVCHISGGDLLLPEDQEDGGVVILRLPAASSGSIKGHIPILHE